ncbi:MAG: GTPase/DUF3482 domain-containing protein [Planctomycetota bacterium]
MIESDEHPLFVVVGNVNQGKSSIVRTLTENGDVPVDSYPGTTTKAARYVFRAEGKELFTLVDTPGFQEPRHVLRWLQQHAKSPAERPAAVKAFVDEHRGGERFQDECELLTPLIEGAGILYVVDASSRFQPANEAEMEILRWTGQPGMALLNRAREESPDHDEILTEWRGVLTQYFNAVREFDAHSAQFTDRIGLLRAFAELRDDWREVVKRAVDALEEDWRSRTRQTAQVITSLMQEAIGHKERHTLKEGEGVEQIQDELRGRYRSTLVVREQEAWRSVEELYGFDDIERPEGQLPTDLREALFDKRSFQLFGLSRTEMMKHGLWIGGTSGAAIDAAVGGLSFGTGLVIGAVAGGVGGWFGTPVAAESWSKRMPKVPRALARNLPGRLGRGLVAPIGEVLEIGPAHAHFAWVLFERALVHAIAIRRRAHAHTGELSLTEETKAVHDLRQESTWFREASRVLGELIEDAKRGRPTTERYELRGFIERSLSRLETSDSAAS